MDPVAAVQLMGGAARRHELAAHGVAWRAVVAACDRGDLMSCGRGRVCLPGADAAPVTIAVRAGAVLSCGAAAVHHGLEVFGRHDLHVTRSSATTVPQRTVRATVHRRQVDADARSTRLLQTLLDCARCLPTAQAVSVLDSALRQGRVEPHELVALVPRSGRHAATVARVVRLTDPAAQSVLESGMRVGVVTAGWGPVRSQVYVETVGWVDFLVREWLVIEVDGFHVHRAAFREDRRRDAELTRRGFVVLRFTYDDVLHRLPWVLEVVADTLRAGRPRFAA